ncbi:MAG: hypothetical protein HY673_14395 [Chloroflexi bacterium]|nr:hypothetical protein [Chloroflexota bacterium]
MTIETEEIINPVDVEESALISNLKLTDSTNAELLAQLWGDRLRYDHQRGRWLLWRGHYWQADDDGEIYRMATEAARERYRRATTIGDLSERQRVANWAIASEQRGRLEAAMALAKAVKPIANSGQDFDADPWLFGVANGIIDLRTGALRPGRAADGVTLHSRIVFDQAARCARWLQFLEEIFDGDRELIDYLQKAFGYSLTGMTREQVYFICYGTGANGKGRLMTPLRYVLGDYAYNAPFSTFELTNRPSIPNDLAAIERRRFITSSETNDGTRLNEARLKALSGEDPCTARYLHKEFFSFMPVCKIWLSVNHKPIVRDDSYGFWRRVRLVPFTRQFKGKHADLQLLDKLLAEAPGILNWLVAGCLGWQKSGLEPTPPAVMTATEEYQAESDPLADFIADCCIVCPSATGKASALYETYLKWSHGQSLGEIEILTSTKFGTRLGKKFQKKPTETGVIYYGIGLKLKGS